MRIGGELLLMRPDARLADRADVIDRRAKPDRLHDRGRTGLELVRRIAVDHAILEHLADHLAAAIERRHRGKVLVFAIEDTDAAWPVELVPGEGIEVATDVLHVDLEMHRALCAVDENRDAAGV